VSRLLFITGDVHANIKEFQSRQYGRIKKNDAVIVCGDFGILWDGGKAEQKKIKSIGRKRYKTLFIDGEHENYDLLLKYPVTEWNGGKVRVLSRNLMHLCRGQVYTINGKKVFTFGGGESVDRELRTENKSWWPQEMPTGEEMEEGLVNLERCGWQVDYILTHDVPSAFKRLMEEEVTRLSPLNVYLDKIRDKCTYKKWVFGGYHRNKRLSQNIEAVYNGVLKYE
jgi:hypothetical protein